MVKWNKASVKATEGILVEVRFKTGKIAFGTATSNSFAFDSKVTATLTAEDLTSGIEVWRERVKLCPRCKVEKAILEFANNKRTRDGKAHQCKECTKLIAKESAQRKKEGKKSLRGKAKKPRRSGRKALKDPKVIDPSNRPSEEEMKDRRGGREGNMERLVYKTIDWIKSGVSVMSCRELICQEINPNTNKPFSERFAEDVTIHANKLIKEDYNLQRLEVVGVHINRYDAEIQRLLKTPTPREEDYDNPKYYWAALERKFIAYSQCLDTLHQKETLLGVHRKGFRLVINNEEETVIKEKKPDIDLSKLTLEEKIELNDLIEKSRQTESEVSGVILRTEEQRVVEDVEFEEVVEQPNVERMENREQKNVQEQIPNLTLETIQEKIHRRLREKAKQQFVEAGSKTAADDKIER